MSQLCFQATPLTTSLTFVNATGAKLDKKSKNAVRGHVTRRVFQERRYRKLGQNPESLAVREEQPRDAAAPSCTPAVLEFPNTNNKARIARAKAAAVATQACVNQFPSLQNMVLRPGILEKISAMYGSSMAMEGLHGVQPLDQMWFQFMASDPALCEVTLSYAATHFSKHSGFDEHIPAAKQKLKAIQMINSRLPDEKSASLPSTLIAVAIMANVERLSGNLATWRVHLKGLQQIVALRERLHGFVANEWLSRSLTWTFLSSAILSPPSHGYSPSSGTESEPVPDDPKPQVHVDTPLIIKSLQQKCFDPLIPLVEEVRDISTSLRLSPDVPIPNAIATAVSLTTRLAAFQTILRAENNSDILVDSFCTALAIYVNLLMPTQICSLTGRPASSNVDTNKTLHSLARSLHELLTIRDVRFCAGIELLLWELFLGAVAATFSGTSSLQTLPKMHPSSSAQSERRWFTEKLSVIADTVVVKTWQDAQNVLDGIFWLSDDLRRGCSIVWDEVCEISARRKETIVDIGAFTP